MPERVVVFLDLIGFSAAIERSDGTAESLLQGYTEAVREMRGDSRFVKPDAQGAEKRWLERGNAIETFLPMSDSIFIASQDLGGLVYATAHLIKASFTIHSLHEVGRQPPVLFRGGIARGTCRLVHQLSMEDGRPGTAANLIGKGVVEAVKVERKIEDRCLKGPRIWLTKDLAQELDSEDRYLVASAPEEDEICDLLWPRASLFDINDKSFDELAANRFLAVAKQGEAAYSTAPEIAKHYRGLLELVARSARRTPENEHAEDWLRRSGLTT